jgi:hypothetical protein
MTQNDALRYSSASPVQGRLLRERAGVAARSRRRGTFWRMVALIYPHRRMMIGGMLLGLGVALTYAASLAGILPVLKIIVEQRNYHDWLLERAADANAWYSPLLVQAARLFPAENTPGREHHRQRLPRVLAVHGRVLIAPGDDGPAPPHVPQGRARPHRRDHRRRLQPRQPVHDRHARGLPRHYHAVRQDRARTS